MAYGFSGFASEVDATIVAPAAFAFSSCAHTFSFWNTVFIVPRESDGSAKSNVRHRSVKSDRIDSGQ